MTYPDPARAEEAVQREMQNSEWWAPANQHVVEVVRYGKWGESFPRCTCGWTGRNAYAGDAQREGDAHVAEHTCPNVDDPVLCKVHEGVFIPEAGCPVHDREAS